MSDIDPNTLLNNVRNAIALGHPAMAQLAFATLDGQLNNGGELPDDWKQPPESDAKWCPTCKAYETPHETVSRHYR